MEIWFPFTQGKTYTDTICDLHHAQVSFLFYWAPPWPSKKLFPRVSKGAGILNLREFNMALLGRWIWKLIQNRGSSWGKIALDSYFRRKPVMDLIGLCSGHISIFWTGIQLVASSFHMELTIAMAQAMAFPSGTVDGMMTYL